MSSENNEPNDKAETIFSKKGKGPVFRRKNKPKNEETGDQIVNTQTAGQLRVQRDLSSLDPEDFPDTKIVRKEDEWMVFSLQIRPTSGFWKGGLFEFKFEIPVKYPFEGPKVICVDKIYHPNIDLEGKICVNILRPWKPTYSIDAVFFALLFLFSHPNPNDPLNNEAAADMRNDLEQFGRNVKQAMSGCLIGDAYFPKNRGLV